MAKKPPKISDKAEDKIKGETKLTVSPFFHASYTEFAEYNPKIDDKLEEFRKRKTRRPPEKMPGEHVLGRRFKGKGVRECHLAGDVLILWQEKNNTVNQLLICDHNDIEGPREASTLKKLDAHLN